MTSDNTPRADSEAVKIRMRVNVDCLASLIPKLHSLTNVGLMNQVSLWSSIRQHV